METVLSVVLFILCSFFVSFTSTYHVGGNVNLRPYALLLPGCLLMIFTSGLTMERSPEFFWPWLIFLSLFTVLPCLAAVAIVIVRFYLSGREWYAGPIAVGAMFSILALVITFVIFVHSYWQDWREVTNTYFSLAFLFVALIMTYLSTEKFRQEFGRFR